MRFSLTIALRYLFSRKKNNVINWITWISVSVVGIVACALVVILSAMNGLSSSVMDLYTNFDPDLKIESKNGRRFSPDQIPLSLLENYDGVRGLSYSLEETALLKYKDNQEVATIKGVSNHFQKITNIDTKIIEGYYGPFVGGPNESVLGINIAYKLGVITDSNLPLRIYIPNLIGNSSGPSELFRSITTYPRGIFDINGDFNSKYIIVSIDQARKLLGIENNINSIEIGIDTLLDPTTIKKEIQTLVGEKFKVKTRFEQNEFLFKSINAEKWITLLILSLVIVLAIFNVIGSLTMLVIDKQKDIFVLQSMGANLKQIRFIFWLEGSLISVIGSLLGLAIGVTLIILQNNFCLFAYGTTSGLDCFPVDLQIRDILIIVMVINTIGALASLIPIRRIK
ncbi:MAG: FtsX-like permease family protein [Flavobacteriales bacterium]|nr:FtsX-like permease family protein [Flavobacteriales bacterium]